MGKLPACGILDELTKPQGKFPRMDGMRVPNVLDYKLNGNMFSEIKRKG